MPKIIENLRDQLLLETKRQIEEMGYAKTTVRSVASACGVGVGTVYNYFSSKDMLIASFMLEDWQACLAKMKLAPAEPTEVFLRHLYDTLQQFMKKNRALFEDPDAAKTFASAFAERHGLLREQLANIIAPACEGASAPDKAFLASFIAEALLTWTVAGTPFPDLAPILCHLMK